MLRSAGPLGSQVSVSGRMLALGCPRHSEELKSPLEGPLWDQQGSVTKLCACLHVSLVAPVWTGLSLCPSEQPPQSRPSATVPRRTPTVPGSQFSGGVLALHCTGR